MLPTPMLSTRTPHRAWFSAPLIVLAASAGCTGGNTASSSTDAGGGTMSGDSGTANVGHTVTQLASLGGTAYSFQIDATRAYALVTDTSTDDSTTVVAVPLSGGAPVTLATDPNYPQGIAVSSTAVYWVDPSGPPTDASAGFDGLVMSVPIAGGSSETVASGQGFPEAIAVDATGIYWVDANTTAGPCTLPPCAAAVGAVMMLPAGATTPVVLADVPAQPSTLAIDADSVYWGTSDGRVMKAAKGAADGGTVTTLAYYESSVQGLVVGGSDLYWSTGTGDIMRTPVGGGASAPVLVGSGIIRALAVDATSLYWITVDEDSPTNAALSSLSKIPLGGIAGATTLWSGSDSPDALQVDGTNVYFTTDSGSLWKLTPK